MLKFFVGVGGESCRKNESFLTNSYLGLDILALCDVRI